MDIRRILLRYIGCPVAAKVPLDLQLLLTHMLVSLVKRYVQGLHLVLSTDVNDAI